MAEYPYPQYKHGTYGKVNANGAGLSNNGRTRQAIVLLGTAPSGQIESGDKNTNKPIVCNSMSEFESKFGYSDDWANYTLCEAANVLLQKKGVGPCVFINVLNPTTHKASTQSTASLTPSGGKVVITSAGNICIDTIVVKKGEVGSQTTLVKDTDYSVKYDNVKKTVTLSELTAGVFGTDALAITYYNMDGSAVTSSDVIGSTDGYGLNTGAYVLKDVYNVTGYIPAYICAPGWSNVKAVHDALATLSLSINHHWNAYMFTDLPLMNSSTPLTLATIAAYKADNGYDKDNEKVFYPMIKGTDGINYHMSVWYAANFLEKVTGNNGLPKESASNTECGIIQDLYFGTDASFTGRVYTDEIINRCLNANGITSAVYMGGRWVLWGSSAASYDQENANDMNTFDTALLMMFYVTNDFQHRRTTDVDKPMSVNALRSIVAEEQAKIDALLAVNALSYGKVRLDVSEDAKSDMPKGDYQIIFDVTNVPLGKSITANVTWTDEGFQIYIRALEEAA